MYARTYVRVFAHVYGIFLSPMWLSTCDYPVSNYSREKKPIIIIIYVRNDNNRSV